jgi:hypothetical protein
LGKEYPIATNKNKWKKKERKQQTPVLTTNSSLNKVFNKCFRLGKKAQIPQK